MSMGKDTATFTFPVIKDHQYSLWVNIEFMTVELCYGMIPTREIIQSFYRVQWCRNMIWVIYCLKIR